MIRPFADTRMAGLLLRGFMGMAVLLLLAGCDSIRDAIDQATGEAEAPPLPGERIAILEQERTLRADPALRGARILLPAPTVNKDWPQAGGFPNHAMHHIRVRDQLDRVWRADVGKGGKDEDRLIGAPVIADGRVYTMDTESVVTARLAEDGDEVWDAELRPEDEDDDNLPGGLAVDGKLVFAATGFGHVVALNAETGEEVWRTALNASVRAAPTVRNGRVFVLTIDNRTIALKAESGKRLWEHEGLAEQAALLGAASPAAEGGFVIVAYTSGELVALKADDGRVLWTDSLASVNRTDIVSALSHIRGLPVIDRGLVIAVSHGGLMATYELRSGRRIWEKDVGGAESPWVAGDYIFLLTTDKELVALGRDRGQVYWVTPLPRFENKQKREKPIVWTGPILVQDRLIIAGSHGEAWAMSPYTGAFIGKVKLPDGVAVPPVVADQTVYFLANDATLAAFR